MEATYIRNLTSSQKRMYYSIMLVTLLSAALITVWDIRHNGGLLLHIGNGYVTFSQLPALLLGSFVGYLPVMLYALVIFAYAVMHDFAFGYVTFIYFLAGIMGYRFVKKRYYNRRAGILAAILISSFLMGNGWFLLVGLGSPNGIQGLTVQMVWNLWIYALPQSLIGVLFPAFFFRHAGYKLKMLSYNGYYYTKEYEQSLQNRMIFRKGLGQKFGILNALSILSVVLIVILLGIGLYTNAVTDHFSITERIQPDEFFQQNKSGEEPDTSWSRFAQQQDSSGLGMMIQGEAFSTKDTCLSFLIKLMLMMASVVVPLMSLVDYLMKRIFIQPIYSLTNLLAGFAKTTDVDRKDYVEMMQNEPDPYLLSEDELGSLYATVVDMARQLTVYIEQIQNDQKLQVELETARKASRAKTEFLSNVSHEIRTPINAILGMDEMILRETKESFTTQYALDIQDSGKILLSLINGLLDSSKIESGKLEILPVEYDLASLVNDLVNMTAGRARAKGLELKVDVDPEIPLMLYGDEVRIRQCVTNILTNAVKYTSKGSISMVFRHRKLKDKRNIVLSVSVTDTGAGIRKEDMDKLFKPFERIEEKKNRDIEGTGLGMTIVQSLLFLMGSQLNVESVYGEGSTFAFDLVQKVVDWEPIGDYARSYEKSRQKEDYHQQFIAPSARVLVVDDVPMNLKVFVNLLKKTQIQIDTADSGFKAIELVKKTRYDLIFLDHRMPEMDGVETLHAMMKLEEANLSRRQPVVALTANAVSGARDMYFAEGFNNYLSKPIDPDKLEQMILHYLPEELIEESTQTGEEREDSRRWKSLPDIDGINYELARQYADDPDTLISTFRDFAEAIPENSQKIEDFWHEKDYNNYTILVHALKSSARLIGAQELSEEAKILEERGDARDGDFIDDKTPELLEHYRRYVKLLAPFAAAEEEKDLPVISEEQLLDALKMIERFNDAFDYDGADSIVETMKSFSMPTEFAPIWKDICKAESAFDHDRLAELLDHAIQMLDV